MTIHSRLSLSRALAFGICAGLTSTGCKVYMPTLAYTPLVQQRGDAEVGATFHLQGQAGLYGAYSPVRHLMITASGAKMLDTLFRISISKYYKSNQGDVGLGYYQTVGKGGCWYIGALGNYGLAYTFSRQEVAGSPPKEYRAHYSRYQGQLYLAWHLNALTIDIASRLTNIHFNVLNFYSTLLKFRA